jgi:hypothetical protein
MHKISLINRVCRGVVGFIITIAEPFRYCIVVATNRASWNIAAAIAHDDKTGLITKPEVTDLIENYKNRLNIG